MIRSEDKASVALEVLVLDADPTVLKGAETLLCDAGLSVTPLSDVVRARDQVSNRFIPVVLCDLETPSLEAALGFIAFVREKSPLSSVIAMSRRVGFDTVAPAFRAGAADVIPKARDQVDALRDRVVAATQEVRAQIDRDRLLNEFAEAQDELLRKLMDASRKALDTEDKLLERDGGASSSAAGLAVMHILLVDDDAKLAGVLRRDLTEERGWRLRHVQSGGEALDGATQTPPHVLVAKESLPDLSGTTVVRTIKANVPGLVALLFSPPTGQRAGKVDVVDQSRLHNLIPSFSDPAELVTQLSDVREALRRKARERRYLRMFQTQNLDLLQRCQRLRQRLSAITGGRT